MCAAKLGIVATAVDDLGRTVYDQKTGAAVGEAPAAWVTVYDCVGTGPALSHLSGRKFVAKWHAVTNTLILWRSAALLRPGTADDAQRAKVRAQTAQRARAELAASVSPFDGGAGPVKGSMAF